MLEAVRYRRHVVGWPAALAITHAVPGAAVADVGVFRDASGDIAAGADLLEVRVTNGKQVRVRTVHRDLRPRQLAGISIYFDINPRRVGPEYMFYSGLGAGRDWYPRKVRRWLPGAVLDCPSDSRVNHRLDVARFTLDRACMAG